MIAAVLALGSVLVSPAWVAEQQAAKAPLVLFAGGDRADYAAGHILGAQFISTRDVSDPDPKLNLQMASIDHLRTLFESRGVSDDTRIVVYFAPDWLTPAARIVVALDYLGLGDHVFYLDGGLPAWKAGKPPLGTREKKPAGGE